MLPCPHEARTEEQVDRWFKKALKFSSQKGWDPRKAKELYRAIVKVVHRMIKEANPEMNALWSAMAGKAAAGGEVTQEFALAILELIIARPGALAQYLHRDLFSEEWYQMVLYGAPRRLATVKANFKLVRDGSTYEGDAGAVRYLTELHAAQAATCKHKDGFDVPVLTVDEFQRLVQRYATLAATAMTDTEDGSSGVVRTPLLVAAPGEALKAGTVTFLSSAVVHHGPPVGKDEHTSVQVICLANKTGDNRGAPPEETMQAQSVEHVLEQSFVQNVLDTPRLVQQLREHFFLRLAAADESVLPKCACKELLRVADMDRNDAAYADARAGAIANAHKYVHKYHRYLREDEGELTDDECVNDEDADHDGPLGRAWRNVDRKGLVRVRLTRATRMSRHAHTWAPVAQTKNGGELLQEPDSYVTPTNTTIYFKGPKMKYRGYCNLLFSGPYQREVGLIKKGTGFLVVTTDGEPDAVVALRPKMVLSIAHGAKCQFIVTSEMQKLYEYRDCKNAAVHILREDGESADVAEDPKLQFEVYTCDTCNEKAWEESFSAADAGAAASSRDLCRKCWSKEAAEGQPNFVRRVFGKATAEGAGNAMCGCSECWALPEGYSRITEDELQEAPPKMQRDIFRVRTDSEKPGKGRKRKK